MATQERNPLVGVAVGSAKTDFPVMQHAVAALDKFGVPREVLVASAHRTPEDMLEFARSVVRRGFVVVIGAAGGSAHLPGMLASSTLRPVCGVAIESTPDPMQAAVGSQVRMPKPMDLAYMGKGESGAWNAGMHAVKIVAMTNPELELEDKLQTYYENVAAESRASNTQLQELGLRAYLTDIVGLNPKDIAPDLLYD